MSVIYMKHPVHGTKVCTSEQEQKYDETNGWTKFDVNALETTAAAAPEDIHDIEELRRKYEVKFGRAPDGRWKEPKLLMELA